MGRMGRYDTSGLLQYVVHPVVQLPERQRFNLEPHPRAVQKSSKSVLCQGHKPLARMGHGGRAGFKAASGFSAFAPPIRHWFGVAPKRFLNEALKGPTCLNPHWAATQ